MYEFVVCFDLWNTLVGVQQKRLQSYAEIFMRRGIAMNDLERVVRETCMTKSGPDTYVGMVDRVLRELGVVLSLDERAEAVRRWETENEAADWYPGALTMLKKLREADFELVLITNLTKPAWRELEKRLAISHRFHRRFVSCEVGITKPEPAMFELVGGGHTLHHQPGAPIMMIGDSAENDLFVPRAMGWQTLLIRPKAAFKIVYDKIVQARNKVYRAEKILIADVCAHHRDYDPLAEMGLTILAINDLGRGLIQGDPYGLGDVWDTWDSKTTLCIAPGRGGRDVHRYLGTIKEDYRWTFVPAKRQWTPGSDPTVEVGTIPDDPRTLAGITDVVIVDDVVSSGITCQRLKEANERLLPGARWHVMTLIKQRAAKLPGFTSVYAVRECGEPSYKVPVNSISTLIEKPDLARDYARRNFQNPERFLTELAALSHQVVDPKSIVEWGH